MGNCCNKKRQDSSMENENLLGDHYSSKGNKMELLYTKPEGYTKVICDICGKHPNVKKEGFYHSPIDKEDYHVHCVDFIMRPPS